MQRAQQCAGDAERCAAERLCSGGVAGSSIPGSRLAAPLDSPLHNIAARPRHSFTGLPVSIMCWRGSRAPEITWGRVLSGWSNGGDVWVVLCWLLTKSTLVPQSLCWCNSERYHDPGVSFWMGKKSILALMCHGGQYIFSSPLWWEEYHVFYWDERERL